MFLPGYLKISRAQRLHYVYATCLTGGVGVLNQVKHGVLEINYHWIGPEDAFSVWTLEFLVENF